MDSVAGARAKVLAAVQPLAAERVPLAQAAGRTLAQALVASRAVPPWACSAMDGYALRAADLQRGPAPRVAGVAYAGSLPGAPLGPGEAVRIFTGAPLPPGADCVVPQERAGEQGGRLQVRGGASQGENVRAAGEDLSPGQVALEKGTRLGPRQLGVCAALGAVSVEVHRRPRVAVIATGDELVAGRIADSNGETVAAALRELGAEVTRYTVGDDVPAVARALDEALAGCDAICTIAGVSVGERDQVPRALAQLGAETLVHGVGMKPGKPFLFARLRGRPVFGLPGSPSACLVAFEVFARPGLLALSGRARVLPPSLRLPLAEPLEGRAGRMRFVWAALEAEGRARPLGRDSAQLRGPAQADLLLAIAEGTGALREGDLVEAWLLAEATT